MKFSLRAGLLSCALFLFILPAIAAPVTLIETNGWWRYLGNGPDQGTAWSGPGYNDAWWPLGAAQLGYGEGDETTVIFVTNSVARPVTAYFRRPVWVPPGTGVANATLRLLRDDGAVVYVNGVEVRRDNMPVGPVTFSTLASATVGGADESTFFESAIPASAFVQGTNIIAVEVHQSAVTSGDLSFALELTVEMASLPVVSVEAVIANTREVSPIAKPIYAPGIVRVSRTGPTNSPLDVAVRMGGTANNGVDYVEIPELVTIPEGAESVDVYVVPFDDSAVEGTETAVLQVVPSACPECYVIGFPVSATVSIADNDTAPEPEPTIISVFARDSDASESGVLTVINPGEFLLLRSGNLTSSIPVYFTLTGTASNGIDYHLVTNPVVIPAGATQALVTIIPLEDPYLEGTETVFLTLQLPLCPAIFPPPPECYQIGGSNQAAVFIRDAASSNQPPFVRVHASDANASEPSGGTNDTGRFTFVRSGGATNQSLPVFFTLGGTATNGVDYQRTTNAVVIPAGSNNVHLVITPIDDSIAEPVETVVASLVPSPLSATYARYTIVSPSNATVFIQDNDTLPEPEITIISVYPGDSEASEPGPIGVIDHGQFLLRRRGNLATSIPVYFTLSGGASNGVDYQLITNPVVIPAGATQAVVNVVPLMDNLVEGTEMVFLTLRTPVCPDVFPPPPECYEIGESNQALVFIRDTAPTNQLPVVRVYASDANAAETSGASNDVGRFTFLRTGPTNESLPVFFIVGGTAHNGSDYAYTTNYVVIFPGSTNAQLVITPTDDSIAEPSETVTITLTPSPIAAPEVWYSIGTPSNAVVFIHDNDTIVPPGTNVTLVAAGSAWKYLDTGADAGTAWRDNAFVDSSWPIGRAQLGFGDGDESTVINTGAMRYVTAYFRRSFLAPAGASFSNLTVRLLRDDGGVVYLNGVEVFRSNMPGGPINYLTLASSSAEEPSQFHPAPVDPALLMPGTNVIAVEIHQNALFSSDLSFDLELIGHSGLPFERTVLSVVASDPEAIEPGLFPRPTDLGQFKILRRGNLDAPIPVQFQLGGTALNGVDYLAISNDLVIPAGATQAVINVVPLMDNLVEGAESIVFTLLSPVCPAIVPLPPGCYEVAGSNRAIVQIRDGLIGTNTPPVVDILLPTNGASFTLPVTIPLHASANDAEDGYAVTVEFFTGTNRIGVATFLPTLCPSPWCPSFNLNWTNPPAGVHELRALATDSAGVSTLSAPVTITVLAVTNLPVSVRVFATDTMAAETSGGAADTGTFTFTRSGSLTSALPVYYTISGTAANGIDYQLITNVVFFPPGSSNAQLVIRPIDDLLVEPVESVTVNLRPAPAGTSPQYLVAWPTNATVYLQDNDTLALVEAGSVWKYLDNGSDAGTAWRLPGFDDALWPSGPAQLGFGDGDEATVINGGIFLPETNRYITAYFRHSFGISNFGSISNLVVRLLRDDGAVGYLNGVEVFRHNMPGGAIDFLTLATSPAEEPGQFHELPISRAALVNGLNVLAVEVHQNAFASSDLSFDLALVANGSVPPVDPTIVSVVTTDPQASEPGIIAVVDAGQFALRRTGNLDLAIPVYFQLSGTAMNGVDYAFISNSIVIPAGATQALVNVVALLDNLPEPPESVLFTLLHPPCINIFPRPRDCYSVGSQAQALVTILDNGFSTNRPPVAFWVAPPNGSVFTQGMSILLRASALDTDGSIQRVEFQSGSTLLGAASFGTGTNFSFMWSNPPTGTHTLSAIAVDNLNARGTSAPVTVTVHPRPPLQTNRELHVVAVYSGLYNGGSSPNHERGDVSVVVDRPGVAVTLFLSAYEPVLWNVVVNPGTIVERVFLAGYYRQDITGLPAGTPLIAANPYTYIGYNIDCASFALGIPVVNGLTGMEISSFHGAGLATAPFLVNSVQNDPRLRSDYPQPVPPGSVPDLSFRLAFHDRGSGSGNVFFQDYNLQGPLSGRDVIPEMRVFADPAGRWYYGVESHEAWRIDTQANTSAQMQPPAGLPQFSWAWSGAFDTLRNRFLIVSFGGEGYLYSYTPAGQQWAVVRSMDNLDLSAIAYHAATDEIFGLSLMFSECDRPTLHRMNAAGAIIDSTPLPITPFGRYGIRTEIVSVGAYLVLLMEGNGSWDEPVDGRVYLYDPRSRQVWLTGRFMPRPDADRDGVPDDLDRCPNTPPYQPVDASGCSLAQRDADADGVPDDRDLCPNTPAGQPVDPNGCSPMQRDADRDGVPDGRDQCAGTPAGAVVNEFGCSIAQLCPCAGPWRNHLEYVRCVESTAQQFHDAGLITTAQRDATVAEARASTCGRRHPRLVVPVQGTDEVRTNGCRLVLEGDGPVTCVIERSPDLRSWTPISTNLLDGATIELVDREACDAPRRFYRLRLP